MSLGVETRFLPRAVVIVLISAPLALSAGCRYREKPDEAYRRAVKTVARQMPRKPHATEVRETRYPNGALRERFYVYRDEKGRELIDGVYTKFHPNGQRKLECEFRDDDLVSAIKRWYGNGTLRSSVFSPRIVWKEGSETQWLPDGRKASEFVYESGIAKTERWWYANGTLGMERTVLDKEIRGSEGLITVRRADGRMLREVHWTEGWKTKVRQWDAAGHDSGWVEDDGQ